MMGVNLQVWLDCSEHEDADHILIHVLNEAFSSNWAITQSINGILAPFVNPVIDQIAGSMCFISGLSNLFKDCPYFWGCFSCCCSPTYTNNLEKIMRKSQNVLSPVPSAGFAAKPELTFFIKI